MVVGLVLVLVSSSWAKPNGRIPASGAWNRFDCGQCHNESGGPLELAAPEHRPTLTVRARALPLAVGVTSRLVVTVESAAPEERRALGFAMRAVPSAPRPPMPKPSGVLTAVDPRTWTEGSMVDDLTHRAPIPFEDGRVTFEVDLTPTAPGNHQVYLVVNDVNANGKPGPGDYVWNRRFCYSIPDGTAMDGEDCDEPLAAVREEAAVTAIREVATPTGETVSPTPSRCGCAWGARPRWGLLVLPMLLVSLRRCGRR